jgi:hypothetical protein
MAEKIGTIRAIVKREYDGMPAGVNVGDEITMTETLFHNQVALGTVENADNLTRAQQRGQASPAVGSAAEARAAEEAEREGQS